MRSAVMPLPLNCDLRLDVLLYGPNGFILWVSVLIESTGGSENRGIISTMRSWVLMNALRM